MVSLMVGKRAAHWAVQMAVWWVVDSVELLAVNSAESRAGYLVEMSAATTAVQMALRTVD